MRPEPGFIHVYQPPKHGSPRTILAQVPQLRLRTEFSGFFLNLLFGCGGHSLNPAAVENGL